MRALFLLLVFACQADAMRNPVPFKVEAATTWYLGQWDASPDQNTVGYRLHYGTFPGVYTQTVDAGNSLSVAFGPLPADMTYYGVANSYNAAGDEGPPSQVAIAGPRPTPSPSPTATPVPLITVSPSVPVFNVPPGQVPPSLDLTVVTSNAMNWSSFDSSPWFDTRPTSGPTNTAATLFPNGPAIQGMSPGTYQQQITFSSSGLPDKIVTAKLIISAPASPTVPPTATPAISPTPRPPTPSPTVKPSTPTPTPSGYTISVSPATGNLPATGGAITFTVTLTPKP